MKQLYPWIFVFLCWSLVNCSKPNEPKPDNPDKVELLECPEKPKGIVGCWNWLETRGVESGILITPQSVGYTQIIRFNPDSIFYHYRNDTLILYSRYQISFEQTPFADTTMVVKLDKRSLFGVQWAVFFSGMDSLTLSDLAFDAAKHRFVSMVK